MSTFIPLPPPPLYDAVLKEDGKLNDAWQKWISLLQIILQESNFVNMSAKTILIDETEAADIPDAPESGLVLYVKESDGNLYAKNSSDAEYQITSF